MKTKVKLYLALLLVGFLSAAAISFGGQVVVAEDGHGDSMEQEASEEKEPANEKDTEQAEDNKDESVNQPGHYVYVTQPGDSYALMARKAVQTYGIKFDVHLSLAEIIFAETNLTLAAGSPRLEVGQEVSIDEALVKDWADKAQALSDEKEAAWEYYVQFANFNTDSVGEAR